VKIIKANLRNLKEIIKAIREDKVLVFPTDTVYGLICEATSKRAVEKIFKIKKRNKEKSIPIFVKNIKMAKKLAYISQRKEEFLKKVWPGKVTVILKKRKIKKELYGVGEKVGLRNPNYKLINVLLNKLNSPLTGTSANISGKPDNTKIKEIINQFRNQKYQPDLVVNAGNLPKSSPSVVIDLTEEIPKILRP